MPKEIAIIPMIGLMFMAVAIIYQVLSYNRFRGLKTRDALMRISRLSVSACEHYVLSALSYALATAVYCNYDDVTKTAVAGMFMSASTILALWCYVRAQRRNADAQYVFNKRF